MKKGMEILVELPTPKSSQILHTRLIFARVRDPPHEGFRDPVFKRL